MVADLEVEARALADLAQRHGVVLPAVGRIGVREVGQGCGERVAALLDLGELGLELLDLRGDRLHPLDHVGGVLARALARSDLVGRLVLRGAAALGLGQ